VRLPEAFAPEAALRLQERMWAELREDFGIGPGRSPHLVATDAKPTPCEA